MVEKGDSDRVFLEESPLFVGLEEREIERLIELAEVREFEEGEVVVVEGSAGDSLFLLQSGELEVSASGPSGEEISLATLDERGAFFGEIALVDPGPRSATVKAKSKATLLEIGLEAMETFFEEFPGARVVILRNIARVLARRLRETNVRVAPSS